MCVWHLCRDARTRVEGHKHTHGGQRTLQNQPAPPPSTLSWVTGSQAHLASTYTCLAISSAPRLAFYFLVLASFPLRSLFCSWSRARELHSSRDLALTGHTFQGQSMSFRHEDLACASCDFWVWSCSHSCGPSDPSHPMGMDRGWSNVTRLSQVEQWAIKRRTLKPFWV